MQLHEVIARLRSGKKNDEGFTLIELLVVVVIIGVLVAIAVPVYLNYRQGAADKSAQSDVRGAISAVEQYYTNNGNSYPAVNINASNAAGATPAMTLTKATGGTDGTVTLSDKTQLGYVWVAAAGAVPAHYLICANNTGGSTNKWYVYNSATGGSVKAVDSAAMTTANCT
jgi:type IV pilus assembly protein PilA